jgi:tRNA (guanine10-N2)-dimethyltransferase
MNKLVILLSGEESSIPVAEAISAVKAYDSNASFAFPSKRIVIAETKAPSEKIMFRIAYARVVGNLVEDVEQLRKLMGGKKIRWKCYSLDGEKASIPDWIEKIGAKVSLEEPDYEIATVVSKECYNVVTIPKLMEKSWSKRRPRARSFFHPSALYPKLARALVNLTECVEGSKILDPFAGTGSMLIEASIVGLEPVGIDISSKMVRGMKSNMENLSQNWLGVIRADSRKIPIRVVDGIATDIPYGRASKTYSVEPEEILSYLVGQALDILPSGKKIVVMHPLGLKTGESGFSVEERHYIKVHRSLTRVITVMRRKEG